VLRMTWAARSHLRSPRTTLDGVSFGTFHFQFVRIFRDAVDEDYTKELGPLHRCTILNSDYLRSFAISAGAILRSFSEGRTWL
jgi:hypothetical protein